MKTLIHLGAQHMHLTSLRTAKEMGLRVIALDPDPHAPGRGIPDRFLAWDLGQVQRVHALALAERASGIFTMAADFPVPTLAQICADLGLPGPSPSAANACTHKGAMRRALDQAGVPCPVSLASSNLNSFLVCAQRMATPMIIKPADSSGGRGITCFVTEPSEPELREAFAKAARFGRSPDVVLEEAVNGPEFSIEAITFEGETTIVAITDKVTSGPPFFVEIGHSQPAALAPEQSTTLAQTVQDTVRALGIDNAASHTEIVLTKDGPRVIEAAARLGGGYINSHLVPLSTGVDIVAAAISVAVGEQPDLAHSRAAGAAIRFLTPMPGAVDAINGLEEARQLPGVEEVVLHVETSDTVHTLSDATTRVGHVIASAKDAATAVQRAEAAIAAVEILTHPAQLETPK